MNNNNTQSTSGSEGHQASVAHNGNRVLRLGLDLHYRQVTVAMQEDGGRIKSVGKMSHQAFGHWVDKKLAEGWQLESCYEAGASGYWLHRLSVASFPSTLYWAFTESLRDKSSPYNPKPLS